MEKIPSRRSIFTLSTLAALVVIVGLVLATSAAGCGPRDKKGNPAMADESVPTGSKDEVHPLGEQYVVEKDVTVYLVSPIRERYVFTSEAHALYDILIGASDKEDPTIGVIFQVAFRPDQIWKKEYRFPGNGPITFETLEDDYQIVTFRWGSDGKGYFDLKSGTATFEEYRAGR